HSMPKRSRKRSHTSGLMPLPQAMRTLWPRSSGPGGALTRYRHSSPTYWIIVAFDWWTSGQNVEWLNFLPMMSVAPVYIHGNRQSPNAEAWYMGKHVYMRSPGLSFRYPPIPLPNIKPLPRKSSTPFGSPVVPDV